MVTMCFVGCNKDTVTDTPQEDVSYCVEIGITYDTNQKAVIQIELCPDYAPLTVTNFLELVQKNYYNGTIMHRVVENFCVQGGGYKQSTNGSLVSAGTVEPIYGEFISNGYTNNTLQHKAGAISMARTLVANSATSQFFLCPVDVPFLDGNYAVFGYAKNEESLLAIQTINRVPTTAEVPNTAVVIDYIKKI